MDSAATLRTETTAASPPRPAAPVNVGQAVPGPFMSSSGPVAAVNPVSAPLTPPAVNVTAAPAPERRAPPPQMPSQTWRAPAPSVAPATTEVTAPPAPAVPREMLSEGVYRQGNRITALVRRVIKLDVNQRVEDIFIGDTEIVRDLKADPGTIFLTGLRPGRTNIILRGAGGRVIARYDMVIEADLSGLREALAAAIPDSRLDVTSTQGGVILGGQVRSAVAAANATRVAEQFVGGEGSVINSLHVAGDQQVLLRVRVAEMNRTARKFLDAGVSRGAAESGIAYSANPRGVYTGLNTGGIIRPTGTDLNLNPGSALDEIALGAGLLAGGGAVGAVTLNELGIDSIGFDALEERGLVRLLAEPALTVISGETANFLVGGEFPVPVGRDADGNITIEFKQFGVKLSFTPVVLSDNQINLRINTEVSRIAEENSYIVNNTVIPGLSTRRADSTIMLPSGGSLMIAGLLQSEDRNTLNGVPGLMDLPILGALFRSTDFQNERSELVVTVEAFKVRPRQVGAGLSLPTDGFRPADDFDMFVLGRLNAQYGRSQTNPTRTVDAPFGYIME
jgi:pilus assembly protein CpaC